MTTLPLYSAEPNAHHGHTTAGNSCTQRNHDLPPEPTFDVKSSLLLPEHDSNSATTPSTAPTTQHRQYAQSIDRGLTDKVAPKTLRDRIRFIALQTIDDYRYVRTLDIAAACFAERPFPAALAAAQRAIRGMARDGLVQEYVTDRHHHIYALTRAGARWLNEKTGGEAAASTRHASELTNPEHSLYENFIKVCCEQRGLTAQTERELLDGLKSNSQTPQGGLLRVRTRSGSTKSLRPDILSHDETGAVWFEIDRSSRGSQRKQDMGLLFSAIGQRLSPRPDWLDEDQAYLHHVVIHAYSLGIMRAAQRILRDTHPVFTNPLESMKRATRIARACRVVTPTNDAAVYEVWAWRKLARPTSEWGQLPIVIGYVTIQLLPRWLGSYRSERKERLKASRGWFVENFLPYVRPPQEAVWRPPVIPFLRGYNWAELGL